MLASLATAAVAEAANRPFTQRFGMNARGDITFAANTIVTCDPALLADCEDRRNGPSAQNVTRALLVDVDGDPATASSSRARLNLPVGADVAFAALYWGGVAENGVPEPQFGQVKLATPAGGGYQPITASAVDTDFVTVAVADVTSLVRAGGAGDYTIADVKLGYGNGTGYANGYLGGWTLAVVYELPTEPWRNLSVFDGLQNFIGTFVDIPLSGFITPPAPASVTTKVGYLGFDGDVPGPTLRINPAIPGPFVTDALTPANAFLNGRITRGGVDHGDRLPNYLQQLGYDSKLIDVPNALPNSATSATLRASTPGGNGIAVGLFTTAIDLFAPEITGTKTITNVSRPGQPARIGDVLEYEIDIDNAAGSDTASNVVLDDPIPAGTSYVAGSLLTTDGEPAPVGARTDAAGDDSAEYVAATDKVTFRVGAGADGTTGGTLAPGEGATVRFRVTLDADAGPQVTNEVDITFHAVTLNQDLTTVSSPTTTIDVEPRAEIISPPPGVTVPVPGGPIAPLDISCTGGTPPLQCSATVTLPDGTVVPIVDGAPLPTHLPGTYTITVTVQDAKGNRVTTTRTYVVLPAPAKRVPKTAAQLALECSGAKLVLLDVRRAGDRVRFQGVAPTSKAGRQVPIRLKDDGTIVARATVKPDGSFETTGPLPKRSIRNTNRARYRAELDGAVSLQLKLVRRLVVDGLDTRNGQITINGHVTHPLGKPIRTIRVRERTECGGPGRIVARVTPGAKGGYKVTFRRPRGVDSAIYRLETFVRKHNKPRTKPKHYPTYTLVRGVDLF